MDLSLQYLAYLLLSFALENQNHFLMIQNKIEKRMKFLLPVCAVDVRVGVPIEKKT